MDLTNLINDLGQVAAKPDLSPLNNALAAPTPAAPDMSGVLGSLPAATPPEPPSPLQKAREELERQVAEAQQRAAASQKALEASMSTNGLQAYLPKPSARQMLSDAITNISLAHLTKGNFTPIQQKRYDEAFKAHGADVQDKRLALDSANAQFNQANTGLTQMRAWEQLEAKVKKDQEDQAIKREAIAQREKATSAATAVRQGMLDLQTSLKGSKESQAAAKARLDSAMANLLEHGGRNIVEATSIYMANSGLQPGTPEYMDTSLKVLSQLKDATTRFNPNAGIVDLVRNDGEGNPYQVVGPKGGAKSIVPLTEDESGKLKRPNFYKATATTKSMVEAAPTVIDFTDKIDRMVAEQADNLGPANSRWRDFWAGKGGFKDEAFTRLRTNVHLLVTNLMRMHTGSRGAVEMMKYFRDMIEEGKQDPANLLAATAEIRDYANSKLGHGLTDPTKAKPAASPEADFIVVNGRVVPNPKKTAAR